MRVLSPQSFFGFCCSLISRGVFFVAVFTAIFLSFAMSLAVFAEEANTPVTPSETAVTQEVKEALTLEENIEPQDLGVTNVGILPGNPFYIFKGARRTFQNIFTFDPVDKAELKMKFASEKLLEMHALNERGANSGRISGAMASYTKELERAKGAVENVREQIGDTEQGRALASSVMDIGFKHAKSLGGISKGISAESFDVVKKAQEASADVVASALAIPKPEDVSDIVTQIIEKQEGSDFNNFKNIEVLKAVGEKVPQQAKDALLLAEQQALNRLQVELEKFDVAKKAIFEDFVKEMGGDEVQHLKILGDLEVRPVSDDLRALIGRTKENVFSKIETKVENLPDATLKDVYLSGLSRGDLTDVRVAKELEQNFASDAAKGVVSAIKNKAVLNFAKQITDVNRVEERPEILKSFEQYHDAKSFAALDEIEALIPEDKKGNFEVLKRKMVDEIRRDVAQVKDSKQETAVLKSIAGDQPQEFESLAKAERFVPIDFASIFSKIKVAQFEKIKDRTDVIKDEKKLQQYEDSVRRNERYFQEESPKEFAKFTTLLSEKKNLFGNADLAKERIAQVEQFIVEESAKVDAVGAPAGSQEELRASNAKRMVSFAKEKLEFAKTLLSQGFNGEALVQSDRARDLMREATSFAQGRVPGEDFVPVLRPVEYRPLEFTDDVICEQSYLPVCGVDQKTYSNKCYAYRAHIPIAYFGECFVKPPVTACAFLVPPGPDFCRDGIIIPGDVDDKGCQLAPKCDRSGEVKPIGEKSIKGPIYCPAVYCDYRSCPNGCEINENGCMTGQCLSSEKLPRQCPFGRTTCDYNSCSSGCEYSSDGCVVGCKSECPATQRQCDYAKCPSGCQYDGKGCTVGCYEPQKPTQCPAGSSYQCDYAKCPSGCDYDSKGCTAGCRAPEKMCEGMRGWHYDSTTKTCVKDGVTCDAPNSCSSCPSGFSASTSSRPGGLSCEYDNNGCPKGCRDPYVVTCPSGWHYDKNARSCVQDGVTCPKSAEEICGSCIGGFGGGTTTSSSFISSSWCQYENGCPVGCSTSYNVCPIYGKSPCDATQCTNGCALDSKGCMTSQCLPLSGTVTVNSFQEFQAYCGRYRGVQGGSPSPYPISAPGPYPLPLSGGTSQTGSSAATSTSYPSFVGNRFQCYFASDAALVWDVSSLAFPFTFSIPKTSVGEEKPPVVSNVRAVDAGETQVTILWTTDVKSDSTVVYNYDASKDAPGRQIVRDLTTEHKVLLQNLRPSTLYRYDVSSSNKYGDGNLKGYYFQTLGGKVCPSVACNYSECPSGCEQNPTTCAVSCIPSGSSVFPFKFSDGYIAQTRESAGKYCYANRTPPQTFVEECKKVGVYLGGEVVPPESVCPSGHHPYMDGSGIYYCFNDADDDGGTCFLLHTKESFICPSRGVTGGNCPIGFHFHTKAPGFCMPNSEDSSKGCYDGSGTKQISCPAISVHVYKGKTTICPLMQTVASCPAGMIKKLTFSSLECGEYYTCVSEPKLGTVPIRSLDDFQKQCVTYGGSTGTNSYRCLFPGSSVIWDITTLIFPFDFTIPVIAPPSACNYNNVCDSGESSGSCPSDCGGGTGNQASHVWTFSDGQTANSMILNRTDAEYTSFIAGIEAQCKKILKSKFVWKPTAGDPRAENWQNFGIPDCSGTATPFCGNGVCDSSETTVSCPVDCRSTGGTCMSYTTQTSCQSGGCTWYSAHYDGTHCDDAAHGQTGGTCNHNNVCDSGETYSSCSSDCGMSAGSCPTGWHRDTTISGGYNWCIKDGATCANLAACSACPPGSGSASSWCESDSATGCPIKCQTMTSSCPAGSSKTCDYTKCPSGCNYDGSGCTIGCFLATGDPIISGVRTENITSTGVTILWTTDRPTTGTVRYGTLTKEDTTLTMAHSITLTGLSSGSVYNFSVSSKDAQSRSSDSPSYSFLTSAGATSCPANSYTQTGTKSCNSTTCPNGCTLDANGCPSGCQSASTTTCPANTFTVTGGKTCNMTSCPNGCTYDVNSCPSGCAITTSTACNNNHICDYGESAGSCPGDCGGATSFTCNNNRVCESNENYTSCPSDCVGSTMACNNNHVCDSGETMATCPADCTVGMTYCGSGWHYVSATNSCVRDGITCSNTSACSSCPSGSTSSWCQWDSNGCPTGCQASTGGGGIAYCASGWHLDTSISSNWCIKDGATCSSPTACSACPPGSGSTTSWCKSDTTTGCPLGCQTTTGANISSSIWGFINLINIFRR